MHISEENLSGWIEAMVRLTSNFMGNFESSFGYPPGDNGVVRAALGDRQGVIDELITMSVGDDFFAFFSYVESVSLPDLGSGFFIHSAQDLLDGVRGEQPVRITGAVKDEITVFGSDGGGGLLALNASHDKVYRLSGGALVDVTYDVNPSGVEIMGNSLWEFLEYLRGELSRASSAD